MSKRCTGPCGRDLPDDSKHFYKNRAKCKVCYNGNYSPEARGQTRKKVTKAARLREQLAAEAPPKVTAPSLDAPGPRIPLIITRTMRSELAEFGYTPAAIAKLTPAQAHTLLGDLRAAAAAAASAAPDERWKHVHDLEAGKLVIDAVDEVLQDLPPIGGFTDKLTPEEVGGESPKERKDREKAERLERERLARLEDDYANLKPDDFVDDDTSIANDTSREGLKASAQAGREKRQEYNRAMGRFADDLRAAAVAGETGTGDVVDSMNPRSADYLSKLTEGERRFGNRRLARSVSLFAAGEEQSRRLFMAAARQYLTGRVQPTGYAARPQLERPIKRSVCLLLSDLHLGADLTASDNPIPFRAVEEARRLEYIMRQAIDYKPQYREHSELVILLNGDLIEGLLMHDFRDGTPLTEQKVIFQRHMERFVGECARTFPRVRVFCQPGNHGRDKLRHPGRATSAKWDGHEWQMMYSLARSCSSLPNVSWDLPFRAISKVDLHGSWLGLSHGDTEVKVGDPDTKAKENATSLADINSTGIHGVQFAAWAFGHYHKGRYHPRRIRTLYNGALVPPNGHARGAGYIGESCGQFLWEATENYPIGDVRFIEVGAAQDRDTRLGTILVPFRFDYNDPHANGAAIE